MAVVERKRAKGKVVYGVMNEWQGKQFWELVGTSRRDAEARDRAMKRETGYGETYAVEVYPRDSDLVNVANMRHLWLFDEPLDCGWFGGAQ